MWKTVNNVPVSGRVLLVLSLFNVPNSETVVGRHIGSYTPGRGIPGCVTGVYTHGGIPGCDRCLSYPRRYTRVCDRCLIPTEVYPGVWQVCTIPTEVYLGVWQVYYLPTVLYPGVTGRLHTHGGIPGCDREATYPRRYTRVVYASPPTP